MYYKVDDTYLNILYYSTHKLLNLINVFTKKLQPNAKKEL